MLGHVDPRLQGAELRLDDLGTTDKVFALLDSVMDRDSGYLTHCPLDWVCLTDPQHEMASDDAPEALWLDGNQVGKSFEQAFDLVHICRGTHPFKLNRPVPVRLVIASVSFDQMEPLMEKIWELLPKDEIDLDAVSFSKGRGITGKPPRIVFVRGPGKGSVINFATYEQGPNRVAGITADVFAMDEPPPESLYGEVVPRLLRRRGIMRITMTPTPGMPPQEWYKKKVDRGEVSFHNHGLSVDAVTPRHWGNPGVGEWLAGLEYATAFPRPFLDQSEIDAFEGKLLDMEREMRMKGAWFAGVDGRWLPNFTEMRHVRRRSRADLEGWYLTVGLDHGTQEGKQTAMLVAVKDRGLMRPRVHWWAETVAVDRDGEPIMTRPEDDVTAILKMLAARGLRWTDVDAWVGDVPTGSARYEVSKSNKEIRREMALALGIPIGRVPQIHTPAKGRHSMTYGVGFLNTLFGRYDQDSDGEDIHTAPHATVDPRCVHFIDFCNRFNGDKYHVTKDVGDAGRYPVERAVAGYRQIAKGG